MKNIVFLLIIFAAAVIQSTLAGHLKIFGVKPDLLFVLVFSASLNFERGSAIFFALVCGILKDSLGTLSFGIHILMYPLWSLAVLNLSKRISFDHPAVSAVFLFFMVFVHALILRFAPFDGYGCVSLPGFFRVGIMEGLYTSAVFVYAGPLLRRVAVSTIW